MYKKGDIVLIKTEGELEKSSVFDFDKIRYMGTGETQKILTEAYMPIRDIAGKIAVIDSSHDGLCFVKIKGYPERIFQIDSESIARKMSVLPNTNTKTPMPKCKPPLGLKPLDIWEQSNKEERILDILQAMINYSSEEKPIPKKWVKELAERVINLMGDK